LGGFVWHHPGANRAINLSNYDKHQLGSYDELMRKSTTRLAWFWTTVLGDLDVQFYNRTRALLI